MNQPKEQVEERVRERLEAEADALEGQNLDFGHPADLTAATVRAVKAQGIRDAVAAALSQPHNTEEEK